MSSQEPQRLLQRLEPTHKLFPLSGWTVQPFDPVVQSFMRPMVSIPRQMLDRLDVASKLVRNYNARLAEMCNQIGQETPGCFRISMFLNKNVEIIAFGINCSP